MVFLHPFDVCGHDAQGRPYVDRYQNGNVVRLYLVENLETFSE